MIILEVLKIIIKKPVFSVINDKLEIFNSGFSPMLLIEYFRNKQYVAKLKQTDNSF